MVRITLSLSDVGQLEFDWFIILIIILIYYFLKVHKEIIQI